MDEMKFGAVSINYGALYNVLFAQLPWVRKRGDVQRE